MSRLRTIVRDNAVPLALLSPAIIIILMVVLLPLIFSFYTSFTNYILIRPDSVWQWVGLRNYTRAVTDPAFWEAFVRTVVFLTICLNLEMLIGLGLALMVNQITWGQRGIRTIMMFPMMFSPILVGFQFKYLFNDTIGFINNGLFSLGLISQPIPFLVDSWLALGSIAVAEIWMSTPIFAILILAGLYAMPKDPIEAARVDGCSNWQVFRHITLPFIMPFIYIAMTIRSLDVARAYDVVKVMTNGGPAGRTELLWTLVGRTAYDEARMGRANAMGYIAILLSIFFTWYFFRKLMTARKHLGAF
jgi:multiple sugar transport system permease protein